MSSRRNLTKKMQGKGSVCKFAATDTYRGITEVFQEFCMLTLIESSHPDLFGEKAILCFFKIYVG